MITYALYPSIPHDPIEFKTAIILPGMSGWVLLSSEFDTFPPEAIPLEELKSVLKRTVSERCARLSIEDITTKTFTPKVIITTIE